ncbi:hypothetical protein D3C71_939290 [compost metagenome]
MTTWNRRRLTRTEITGSMRNEPRRPEPAASGTRGPAWPAGRTAQAAYRRARQEMARRDRARAQALEEAAPAHRAQPQEGRRLQLGARPEDRRVRGSARQPDFLDRPGDAAEHLRQKPGRVGDRRLAQWQCAAVLRDHGNGPVQADAQRQAQEAHENVGAGGDDRVFRYRQNDVPAGYPPRPDHHAADQRHPGQYCPAGRVDPAGGRPGKPARRRAAPSGARGSA